MLSRIFCQECVIKRKLSKNFVKSSSSVRTVWKNEKFSLTRNISSILLFINLFSKSVIFTEILPKLRERGYPTVWKFLKFFPSAKNFRQVGLQYNSLVKYLIWRNFCKTIVGVKFALMPQFFAKILSNQRLTYDVANEECMLL